jgi:RNA polymerase sigma-70 factor, ECF subfamily
MSVGGATKSEPDRWVTSFADFYDRAVGDVYRYLAHCLLGDRAVAEDLTQDTFTAVLVAGRAGRAEALTMPWVMGVARHKLLDHYRRTSRDERHLAMASARSSSEEQELDLLAGADPSRVLEAMRTLSNEHRLVLILRYHADRSVREIAAELNRTEDAIQALLSRARRALAHTMAEVRDER